MIDKDNKKFVNIVYRVDILDLERNEWTKAARRNKSAQDCGVYYDESNAAIYVGGGYTNMASRIVECYDMNKDKWEQLPDTNYGHDMNPLIWIEDNNLLHIASIGEIALKTLI